MPLADDVQGLAQQADTDSERNLLTQIFRFFTQADVEVNNCYMRHYRRVFKPTEVQMMLSAFSNMETVHIAAYSHLLDTIGMPETEYSAFLQVQGDEGQVRLHAGVQRRFRRPRSPRRWRCSAPSPRACSCSPRFAMLMNFPRFNKMKGMGQIISWSVRDETLHCNSIIKLFRTFVQENADLDRPRSSARSTSPARPSSASRTPSSTSRSRWAPVEGMNARASRSYIRYIADRRLSQLGLQPIYMVDENPLPWMDQMLNAVEHTNFFENRATEYSKAATRGDWNTVWESFDRRMKAKAGRGANDGAAAAGEGPDMFEAAGVAAE